MSSKQKNIALVVGFFGMLVIAYQFSFQKTIELKSTLNKLSEDKVLLSSASETMSNLQIENRQLDAFLMAKDVSANQSFEQTLFQKITKLSKEHKIKIISFEKPHVYQFDEAKELTYTIETRGDFRNLMLFSSHLEKQRLGKFSSTSFLKKKNYRTGRYELFCKIILQKLSK